MPQGGVIANNAYNVGRMLECEEYADLNWINHRNNCPKLDHEWCDYSGTTNCLAGDWKKEKGKYVPDENGYFAAIVGEFYTQVVFSKFVVSCRPCSPCYPDQNDLESLVEDGLGFDTYFIPKEYLFPEMIQEIEEKKAEVK